MRLIDQRPAVIRPAVWLRSLHPYSTEWPSRWLCAYIRLNDPWDSWTSALGEWPSGRLCTLIRLNDRQVGYTPGTRLVAGCWSLCCSCEHLVMHRPGDAESSLTFRSESIRGRRCSLFPGFHWIGFSCRCFRCLSPVPWLLSRLDLSDVGVPVVVPPITVGRKHLGRYCFPAGSAVQVLLGFVSLTGRAGLILAWFSLASSFSACRTIVERVVKSLGRHGAFSKDSRNRSNSLLNPLFVLGDRLFLGV